jgi:uncharacterized protein (DUF433 family)
MGPAEPSQVRWPDFIASDPVTPVFAGTRVPIQTLLDYLAGGHRLDEFLDDFPTVKREQAVALLEHAKALLVASTSPAR